MGMDQDFPMTRTQLRVLAVGLLAMAIVGVVVFGGFVPGVRPAPTPSTIEVNGQPYYFTVESLAPPALLENVSPPQQFVFHHVTFVLWIVNWYSVTGPELYGNGTELNGTTYSFVLGIPGSTTGGTNQFLSPDLLFGVYWLGGLLAGNTARLMVHA